MTFNVEMKMEILDSDLEKILKIFIEDIILCNYGHEDNSVVDEVAKEFLSDDSNILGIKFRNVEYAITKKDLINCILNYLKNPVYSNTLLFNGNTIRLNLTAIDSHIVAMIMKPFF